VRRGLALALALTGAVTAARRFLGDVPAYDRFELPAFDSYVYVAMAEHPRFFTAAPWGYRILGPALAAIAPAGHVVGALTAVTLASLTAAGGLLFLFLRRRGFREAAALLAVAVFALSGPVGEALGAPFLGDPLAVALMLAFVLALEHGAPVGLLALLAVLSALCKETFALLLPAVYLARRHDEGRRRALAHALAVAAPALLAVAALRLFWAPHLQVASPPLDLELVRAGLARFRTAWPRTWPGALLGGVLPLAVLGAVRGASRPFLRRYGYLAAALVILPFVAWINIPSREPVPLFGANAVRLLIHALPLLLPLALLAVDRAWPTRGEPAAPWPAPAWLGPTAAAAALACAASPFALDRYRRVPLHERRDGPLVLATCRQSLAAAARLQAGEGYTYDPARDRFVPSVSDIHRLNRMRWYLRRGWGPAAHYGDGDVVMQAARADILLPCLRPRPLRLVLSADAARAVVVDVSVNGQTVGQAGLGPRATDTPLGVPAALLFRGDNELTLAAPEGAAVRLRALTVAPAGTPAAVQSAAPGAK
jgi:hypothetical protein